MLERVNNFGLWWERLQNLHIISMTIFYYNPKLTLNIKLFCCENHRSSHWRCSVKESVLKNFTYNFIKKRLQDKCFLVKLAKVLRTFIFKNICERLLLLDITEKTFHLILFIYFCHKIITISFEALKFLMFFCAVIPFANLFYENILSFLLC